MAETGNTLLQRDHLRTSKTLSMGPTIASFMQQEGTRHKSASSHVNVKAVVAKDGRSANVHLITKSGKEVSYKLHATSVF
eukprot:CAMPEP_0204013850 /NCGR_PEP_ID=MMETSP0360-20130528/24985_1 /ASSEMBLY_ACC=CAM_ASM_000342 /TAXON_ID=268821 /ORGANISM="Scrippsiella Hangoei, Strain SHTV-5" /LENGTH=79 /DNA_ID=CAMNT_0050956651 /DNA_START=9 /DNA_END=245 /DNA_ORIENTATION=-